MPNMISWNLDNVYVISFAVEYCFLSNIPAKSNKKSNVLVGKKLSF
jgi:hypothetical protein